MVWLQDAILHSANPVKVASIDRILVDSDLPDSVPIVRLVSEGKTEQMTEYVTLKVFSAMKLFQPYQMELTYLINVGRSFLVSSAHYPNSPYCSAPGQPEELAAHIIRDMLKTL